MSLKKILTEAGMGTIQAAVGVASAAAIGYFTMDMIQQKSGADKSATIKAEAMKVVTDIGTILKDTQACENSFIGKNAAETEFEADGTTPIIKEMKNAYNETVFNMNQVVGSTKLSYEVWFLRDSPGVGDNVAVIPGSIGTTNLFIKFKPKKGTIYETRPLIGRIRLSVKTNSSGLIESCFSMGAKDDEHWQLSPGNPSEIFYAEGNVGVGNTSPKEKLDVSGWIQSQTPDGQSIKLGGEGASYQAKASVNRPLAIWNDAVNGLGNLKVRDARADGYIKISEDLTLPCDDTRRGSIRYNHSVFDKTYRTASGTFGANRPRVELCTAVGWQIMNVQQWCLPTKKYKPNDDADDVYMEMTQDDDARGPYNAYGGCKIKDINHPPWNSPGVKKKHAKLTEGTAPFFISKFKSDDSGKTKKCTMNNFCEDYRTGEQAP